MFKKRPEPETEIDIEHLPVMAIERRGSETVVSFTTRMRSEYIKCSMEQHNRFVARVRSKFGLSTDTKDA